MERNSSEIAAVESFWRTLDDRQLIKDVVMKGKFISQAITFIANRTNKSIEETKQIFQIEVFSFIDNLLTKKQLHRAIHVIKNVQFDEFYYLFDFYEVFCLKISWNFITI